MLVNLHSFIHSFHLITGLCLQRIGAERDSLIEMNEELKCTQLQNMPGMGVAGGDGHLAADDMLAASPELR